MSESKVSLARRFLGLVEPEASKSRARQVARRSPPRLLLLALALTTGCGVWSTATAGAEDYDQYRRVRTESAVEARLSEAQAYLARFPDGHWRPEVSAWFARESGSYLRRFWDHRAGLERYVRAVPTGPFTDQARRRIAVLEASERRERAALAAQRQRLSEAEALFKDAHKQRQNLLSTFREWLTLLAGIRSFGQPTSALPHEFLHRFREVSPVARCEESRCTKALTLPFAVGAEGGLTPRRAVIRIQLLLEDGLLVEARLSGEYLLTHLGEARRRQVTVFGSEDDERKGLLEALDVCERALRSVLPEEQCSMPSAQPELLVRRCQGVELTVLQGNYPDGTDQIRIRPLPPAPPPSE